MEHNTSLKQITIVGTILPLQMRLWDVPWGPDLDHFDRRTFQELLEDTILPLEPRNVLLMIVGASFSYNDKLTPLKCASRTRLKPIS